MATQSPTALAPIGPPAHDSRLQRRMQRQMLEQADEARVAQADVSLVSGRRSVVASGSLLDDPATVFPVVIDPTDQLGQAHVLRVTDDWSQWDEAVGNRGKIGYNGWSAPYYRSRMFYQFDWPVSGGIYVKLNQIREVTFSYKQNHSPQNSPCSSTSTSYPGVFAKLANVIWSTDTWADRTGDAWHPWPGKRTYLAVGNEATCDVQVWQEWN